MVNQQHDDDPCRGKGIDGLHEGGKVETVSYEKPGNMILTQGAEVCICRELVTVTRSPGIAKRGGWVGGFEIVFTRCRPKVTFTQ